MIECTALPHFNPRELDGKIVYTRFSRAYFCAEDRKFYSEIPEGADASKFGTYSGMLRQDQTGRIYEVAHDVEDAPYTYTEVFPDIRLASEAYISGTGVNAIAYVNFAKYPNYSTTNTYAEGDIVSYLINRKTYISDIDDNKGNTPGNYWGWTEYQPFIEKVEPEYKSIEEWEAEEG